MTFFEWLKQFVIALVVFLVIDMVWLLIIAKNIYAKHLGHLMSATPNLAAAGIFYLIFIAGLVFFVLAPALESGQWQDALYRGLFFGFVTYATYDLTNMATLKDWPAFLTIIDLAWGSFVSAATSVLSFFILNR